MDIAGHVWIVFFDDDETGHEEIMGIFSTEDVAKAVADKHDGRAESWLVHATDPFAAPSVGSR